MPRPAGADPVQLATVVRDDLTIDLPDKRDQLTTRSSRRFAELRARLYERMHRAKTPAVEPVTS